MIEALDDPQFAAREKATAALLRVADQAQDSLRSALERPCSAEAQQRIRRISTRPGTWSRRPSALRELRSVEVLEMIGTPAGREQLSLLAGGAAGAR